MTIEWQVHRSGGELVEFHCSHGYVWNNALGGTWRAFPLQGETLRAFTTIRQAMDRVEQENTQ